MKRLAATILCWSALACAQQVRPFRIANTGTTLAREYTLNFINGGCVDNAAQARTDCTVSTAGAGLAGSYNSGASNADETTTLTNALGTPTWKDSAVAQANGVGAWTDNSGTLTYFNISSINIGSQGPFATGTTQPNWLLLNNTSAATALVQAQYSLDILLIGRSWNGAASKSIGYDIQDQTLTTGVAGYTTDLAFTPLRAGVLAGTTTLTLSYDGTNHSLTFGGTAKPSSQYNSSIGSSGTEFQEGRFRHLFGGSSAAPLASNLAANIASITCTGNDVFGTCVITTGAGTTSGCAGKINLQNADGTPKMVSITATEAAAASFTWYPGTVGAGTFQLCTPGTLQGVNNYTVNYLVGG